MALTVSEALVTRHGMQANYLVTQSIGNIRRIPIKASYL